MGSSGKQVVYVKWLDHAKTDGDPKELKPVVRHTIGWLVKETKEYVCVSADLSREPGGKKQVREYGFCIVKSLILDSWACSEQHLRARLG